MKYFVLPIVILLTLASCSKDEAPQPAYQISLAELTADGSGCASRIVLDDGRELPLTQTIGGLKADSTYRIQALFTLEGEKVTLHQRANVLTPKVAHIASEHTKTDPVGLTACWQGAHYINLRLAIQGTAQAVHYLGFNQTDFVRHTNGTRTLCVELIHDQNRDPLYYTRDTFLSLPLRPLQSLLRVDTDSLRLTINTFSGPQTMTFPFTP